MAFSPKHRTRTYSTTAEELLKATNQVHILMGHHRNYMIDQRSKPPRRSSIPTILEILPSTSFLHDVEPSVIENISVRRTYHNLLVVENTQPLKRVRSLPSLKHANAQLKIQQQLTATPTKIAGENEGTLPIVSKIRRFGPGPTAPHCDRNNGRRPTKTTFVGVTKRTQTRQCHVQKQTDLSQEKVVDINMHPPIHNFNYHQSRTRKSSVGPDQVDSRSIPSQNVEKNDQN
jgi:hypothetical protein